MTQHSNSNGALNTGRDSSDLLSTLRAQIVSGKLAAGSFLPTVRNLSGKQGVAHGTAWRALKALESEGLVEARPRRGYRVLPADARRADGGTLAYVMDQRNVSAGSWELLYRRLLAEMERSAAGQGARVLKLIMNPGEEGLIAGQLATAGLSGLVLDGLSTPLLAWAAGSGVPTVVVDDWAPDLACDSVVQDGFAGGELAARHLLDQGCRRIAWLGHVDNPHGRCRYGGASAALAAAGRRFSHEENCPISEEAFAPAAARLLAGPEPADGVIAFWRQAYGPLVRAARAAGLELGRGLQAVCWCPEEMLDDSYAARFEGAPVPPTVTWRIREMADLALALLAERRRNRALPPASTRLSVRLAISGGA
ncbi:MAG TPA: GntR family transcriptional regulator [Planctomycetota bacterium]|nr:GntR family transcriptional regulator [Planctomycetota bacterium]